MYPERQRSTLAKMDNALLVVGAVVVGFLALRMLGWIVGTVFFVVKVALVAFVIAAAARFAMGRSRR